MPNHCENELNITGPRTDLLAFKEKARALSIDWGEEAPNQLEQEFDKIIGELQFDDLSCNAFVPVPPEVRLDYNEFGYRWCIDNWGTKWGCYEVTKSLDKRTLRYSFQTAWSPPLPVIKAMSEQHPTLRFMLKFWEGGAGYKGVLKMKAGRVIKHETYDYRGGRGG